MAFLAEQTWKEPLAGRSWPGSAIETLPVRCSPCSCGEGATHLPAVCARPGTLQVPSQFVLQAHAVATYSAHCPPTKRRHWPPFLSTSKTTTTRQAVIPTKPCRHSLTEQIEQSESPSQNHKENRQPVRLPLSLLSLVNASTPFERPPAPTASSLAPLTAIRDARFSFVVRSVFCF